MLALARLLAMLFESVWFLVTRPLILLVAGEGFEPPTLGL
jgi:hypothetical protein